MTNQERWAALTLAVCVGLALITIGWTVAWSLTVPAPLLPGWVQATIVVGSALSAGLALVSTAIHVSAAGRDQKALRRAIRDFSVP